MTKTKAKRRMPRTNMENNPAVSPRRSPAPYSKTVPRQPSRSYRDPNDPSNMSEEENTSLIVPPTTSVGNSPANASKSSPTPTPPHVPKPTPNRPQQTPPPQAFCFLFTRSRPRFPRKMRTSAVRSDHLPNALYIGLNHQHGSNLIRRAASSHHDLALTPLNLLAMLTTRKIAEIIDWECTGARPGREYRYPASLDGRKRENPERPRKMIDDR